MYIMECNSSHVDRKSARGIAATTQQIIKAVVRSTLLNSLIVQLTIQSNVILVFIQPIQPKLEIGMCVPNSCKSEEITGFILQGKCQHL